MSIKNFNKKGFITENFDGETYYYDRLDKKGTVLYASRKAILAMDEKSLKELSRSMSVSEEFIIEFAACRKTQSDYEQAIATRTYISWHMLND